ncbi:hypothetical protein MNBD_GAMMA05-2419 [hydrothermal vent metagenome]|uniref:HTH cro/C1-type domain-containing protein n=1 Tax=hydrothermal vent metagenome TaxID=652676 RepID=A0A3B0WRX3_9ZZZZ
MSYLNDKILRSLKRARKAKGLSQRELSAKSGVPQSHISKIENGAVDLRVSSLVALARTLDLELELVPRKIVPAVQSIVRKTINTDLMNTQKRAKEVINNYRETINAISNVGKINLPQNELDKLNRNINEISNLMPRINSAQLEAISSSRKVIEEVLNSGYTKEIKKVLNSGYAEEIKKAFEKIDSVRNTLAHSKLESITKSLPAYSLDNEVDDE